LSKYRCQHGFVLLSIYKLSKYRLHLSWVSFILLKNFLYVGSPFIGSPHPFRNFLNMGSSIVPFYILRNYFLNYDTCPYTQALQYITRVFTFLLIRRKLNKTRITKKKITSLRVSISQKIRGLLINQNLIGPRNSFKRHKKIPQNAQKIFISSDHHVWAQLFPRCMGVFLSWCWVCNPTPTWSWAIMLKPNMLKFRQRAWLYFSPLMSWDTLLKPNTHLGIFLRPHAGPLIFYINSILIILSRLQFKIL